LFAVYLKLPERAPKRATEESTMDCFFSAFLVVINSSALDAGKVQGTLNRIAFYGPQIQGFVLSRGISIGMTDDQVRARLGADCLCSNNGNSASDIYDGLGVVIRYSEPHNMLDPLRVERVDWRWRSYQK
jgi:hypothetical protein